ncbi:hypothetical protein [Mycobacterium malmoense]|uniref:hypothetical protein n=1 Tax=Mycobacterium malmoense TaxID=1780 RepID=UPI00114D4D19|nr:hypothetical protein [Mycobacterium malmoense]
MDLVARPHNTAGGALAALRPLATAGVAAVGASLIALTPAVSNDVAADIQHGTATIQYRAVELADTVVNPIQTWIDTFEILGINLQSLATQFQAHPFPLAQQVAANFLQYGGEYVTPYQRAVTQGLNYFFGTGSSQFVPLMQSAWAAAAAGNFAGSSGAVSLLDEALWFYPATAVGQPLETIPQILNPITQNLANATNFATTTGISDIAGWFIVDGPPTVATALGTSLQNIYDSFAAGNPVGGVINAIDLPGEVTNALLNGLLTNPKRGYNGGIFSEGPTGLVKTLVTTVNQQLAAEIVAPNAQNIMSGGSLQTAFQNFVNTLTTGWPSPQEIAGDISNLINYLLGNSSSAAAAVNVADFGTMLPAASSAMASLPGLSADVLKALDPAAVTSIAGSLGPSLAADVAGSLGSSLGPNIAGSLATTLSVDLSTLALHILSAL